MKIDKKIFKVEYTRGTGPGGQNKNKVETCVVITHLPSGLKEKCEDTRHKNKNLKIAYDRLVNRLKEIKRNEEHERLNEQRKSSIENAGVIRTYNFQRNTVKDNRTNKTANLKKVLDGNIDLLH